MALGSNVILWLSQLAWEDSVPLRRNLSSFMDSSVGFSLELCTEAAEVASEEMILTANHRVSGWRRLDCAAENENLAFEQPRVHQLDLLLVSSRDQRGRRQSRRGSQNELFELDEG
jgi:hypothetical protein